MQPQGRLSAAIEVLADLAARHRPVAAALKDWGLDHRFAGSGDRAAIGNIVYDALRRKASIGWAMDTDEPRALALGALRWGADMPVEQIARLCDGSRHAPAALSDQEQAGLNKSDFEMAPDWVRGDYPAWLNTEMTDQFGDDRTQQGAALARRAPLDIRVNTLKTDVDRAAAALKAFRPAATPLSPIGLRFIEPGNTRRLPNITAEPGYRKGWFEVQDEGSQLASLMATGKPGAQILDLCAGAGGKTLALSAALENKGQVFAYDNDRHRLAGIWQRLRRAGCRNVQVLDAGDEDALTAKADRMDLVFVDAPCSGSGAWRRRPDTKWRLSEQSLTRRLEQQRAVLSRAAGLVRPGGRLIYVTCSVLPVENRRQADWFLSRFSVFRPVPADDLWRLSGAQAPMPADGGGSGILLTPKRTGTDGFFICAFDRTSA
jgi:16S rRNA (cytosine967-C5)-methyltransferase